MLLVLGVHVNFGVEASETATAPVSAFSRIFWEAACLICVNLFVLISGYFSIRLSPKRIAAYIFIVLFWNFITYAIALSLPPNHIAESVTTTKVMLYKLAPFTGNWFVTSYFILMLFAPILNRWVETCSQKELLYSILAIYALMFYFYALRIPGYFNKGYSPLALFEIYLIGRYLKLYPAFTDKIKSSVLLLVYLLSTIVVSTIGFLKIEACPKHISEWFGCYISPFTMVSSIAVFLVFTRSKFQSRVVNFFAVSAFSVLLVHTSFYIQPYFRFAIRYLYDNLPTIPYIFAIIGFIIGIYLIITVIDRIRIGMWEGILRLANQRQKR